MCNEAYRLLAFYTVSFDTQELIDRSVRALDAHLNISKVYVKTEYGEQTAQLTSREQLEQGQAFVKNTTIRTPLTAWRWAMCATTLWASWWRKPA